MSHCPWFIFVKYWFDLQPFRTVKYKISLIYTDRNIQNPRLITSRSRPIIVSLFCHCCLYECFVVVATNVVKLLFLIVIASLVVIFSLTHSLDKAITTRFFKSILLVILKLPKNCLNTFSWLSNIKV